MYLTCYEASAYALIIDSMQAHDADTDMFGGECSKEELSEVCHGGIHYMRSLSKRYCDIFRHMVVDVL